MYTRDHGKAFVKSLSQYARKLYKRAKSKGRSKVKQNQPPACPYCYDDTCGGWCG